MKIFAIIVAYRYPTDSVDQARLANYSETTSNYILNETRIAAIKVAELVNVRDFLNTTYGVGIIYLGWDLVMVGSKATTASTLTEK